MAEGRSERPFGAFIADGRKALRSGRWLAQAGNVDIAADVGHNPPFNCVADRTFRRRLQPVCGRPLDKDTMRLRRPKRPLC